MPRIAFFDLDGTITHRDTLVPYVFGYLARHPWRLWRLLGALPALISFALGRADHGALKGAVIHAALGGLSLQQIEDWNSQFVPRLLQRGVFRDARAAIEAHRAAGDRLVLMSASVDLYVPEIGRRLGFDETVCSRVRWQADRLDGRLAGLNCRGEEKLRVLLEHAARDPARPTCAYGNSSPDLPHLARASEGILVNARPATRARARALGIATRETWS
jgi:phosphatidylglycerophosphatase C